MMALSERVEGRLYNWKFATAAEFYRQDNEVPDEEEGALIEALSETFGNCGHFDGHLATVIRAAVIFLIGNDYD